MTVESYLDGDLFGVRDQRKLGHIFRFLPPLPPPPPLL